MSPEFLEIASGDRPFGGDEWTHHDARPLPHIEIVCDNEKLNEHVAPDSVRGLRAAHILEHFSWRDTVRVLEGWRWLMMPGGWIHLEVPNGQWQVRAAASGELAFSEFVKFAYGDQDYSGNAHFASFNQALLFERLAQAGFANIQIHDIGMVLIADAIRPAR